MACVAWIHTPWTTHWPCPSQFTRKEPSQPASSSPTVLHPHLTDLRTWHSPLECSPQVWIILPITSIIHSSIVICGWSAASPPCWIVSSTRWGFWIPTVHVPAWWRLVNDSGWDEPFLCWECKLRRRLKWRPGCRSNGLPWLSPKRYHQSTSRAQTSKQGHLSSSQCMSLDAWEQNMMEFWLSVCVPLLKSKEKEVRMVCHVSGTVSKQNTTQSLRRSH